MFPVLNPIYSATIAIPVMKVGRFKSSHRGFTLVELLVVIGNFLKRLTLAKKIKDWSFRTLQVKLIKIGVLPYS